MNKKNIPVIVVIVIIAGGIGFFGGMKYGQSRGSVAGRNFQNLTPEQRQQMGQGFRNSAGVDSRGNKNNPAGGGFVNGEIISQDDKSVTVKLRDGGSKIIFFSDTTSISKMADGVPTDLGVGKSITVTGSTNSDGSVTAQSIQIRPITAAPTPPADQNPK